MATIAATPENNLLLYYDVSIWMLRVNLTSVDAADAIELNVPAIGKVVRAVTVSGANSAPRILRFDDTGVGANDIDEIAVLNSGAATAHREKPDDVFLKTDTAKLYLHPGGALSGDTFICDLYIKRSW